LSRSIDISPPESFGMSDSPERLSTLYEQAFLVTVAFRFVVEDLLDSEFITIFPVAFTKELVQSAMSMGEEAGDASAEESEDDGEITGHRQVPTPIYEADYPEEAPRGKKQAAEPARTPPPPPPRKAAPPPEPAPDRRPQRKSVEVTPLQFSDLDASDDFDHEQVNLDLVMDIDLSVVVEIGRIKKLVKEIVALRAGSIIELEKQAGEPVDIMVNGKLIARGDVVIIDDNFGVRVTEIVGNLSRP
jgi:flagellar motor switch protein FliN/FliY